MRLHIALAILFLALTASVHTAFAEDIFQDGFESGPLGPAWTVSSTANGRAEVSSDHGPATGQGHLVLDDSVSDATFSAAEASLVLNLKNRKNVVLSFKAKSLGNEPHTPPTGTFSFRTYDTVAVSVDGGSTWRSVQSLANIGTTWQTFNLTLDTTVAAMGGSFGSNFRIRFSAFDNAPAPIDGIAIDDVSVTADEDQRVVLEMPATLTEGTGPHVGYVLLNIAPSAPLAINLASVPAGQIVTPASVTVPAGEMMASFEFTVAEDSLVNFTRTVTVTPSAANVIATAASVTVLDNEPVPVATLTVPATVAEGASPTNNATLSLNTAPDTAIAFTFTNSPSGELNMPSSVTVAAGQTQVVFTLQALNDSKLDGSIPVTITGTNPFLGTVTAQTIALDNEIPALTLAFAASVTEGTSTTGTLTMSGPLATAVDVNLSSSAVGTLTVPATVTIPAGQTSATFTMTATNDTLVNLGRLLTITASGTGVSGTSKTITVTDDEPAPVMTLSIPATLKEGESPTNNGTLSLNVAATTAITVNFSPSVSNELSAPSSISIPAGTTQVPFTVRASDDIRIDGSVSVTLTATATAAGLTAVTASTTTQDNETRTILLTTPTAQQEGTSSNWTVGISGTLTTDLQVTLANTNAAALIVPASVTITAGSTQATLSVPAPENNLKDGTRTAGITATAASFTSASRSVTVRDNDPAAYLFSGIPDIVNVNNPVSVTISVADVEGNAISGYAGSVNLSLVLPDGTTQAVTPAGASLSGTPGWTGNVTIPAAGAPGALLKLRASDAGGITGETTPFELMRIMNLVTADLLWDGARNRIYASVPAASGSPHANTVVAIDPATLSVTGSVTTNQDPGQLALTSGGEYLYVALKANGTVAKIDPSTMTVLSTFAVGTHPNYGTLFAEDMCTVAGQPNLLVISQYRKGVSPRHDGVAVYDNGVMRPTKTQDHTGSNFIEPSADPTIFFGYNTESTEYGLRRLKLSAGGLTQLDVNGSLLSGFGVDMRSDGDLVFSTTGIKVQGQQLKRLGAFTASGLVAPDVALGRVYFLEPQTTYSSTYDKLSAHDPATLSLIRRLTFTPITSPGSFIRWGSNGLAFRTSTYVALIGSSRLIPTDPPADLATVVQATPNPVQVGQSLVYTITTSNLGPNVAHGVNVLATLSDSQTLQSATSPAGAVSVSGSVLTLTVGDLAVGASVSMTVTTVPQSAGALTCTASANSNAVDLDFANNVGFRLVSVGFQSTIDSVNTLRLPANNLIYDPTRNLLWATLPNTVDAPLGRSLVSIDPTNGLVSAPIPINANPMARSIALSANGRYLYVGLSDVPEVHRVDLATAGNPSSRIPLGMSQWGSANYAQDIQVLDGDGTSFIMAGSDDHSAAVYDPSGMRVTRSGIYTVDRIERSPTSNVFVGYNNYTSGFQTSLLPVTASGVTIGQSASNIISGYNADISGSGSLLLASTGRVVDLSNLSLKADIGVSGRPCAESAYQRAYLVNGNALRAYNANTGNSLGTLTLPTAVTGDWALGCLRWGLDGFAILGNDGKVYITRWSNTIPAGVDQNTDHIADAWAAANFSTLSVDPAKDTDGDGLADALEYLMGTSPLQQTVNPIQVQSTTVGGQVVLHLIFPRRSDLAPGSYGYETSGDVEIWNPATSVTETVISTQTVNGVQLDTVDAAFPFPAGQSGFVRLKWLPPSLQ